MGGRTPPSGLGVQRKSTFAGAEGPGTVWMRPTAPGSEEELASIAGKSRSAFSRAFKAHTGLSLVQFINRLRINFACQLLMTDPDLPIIDLCFQAGFNNLSNFNRRFLAMKGMSPSQFRHSHPRSAG